MLERIMPRKTLCLFVLLFILFTMASPTSAQDQTAFGPKGLTIRWWHIHLSFHRFTLDDPGDGLIIITKNTPEKKIRGGFLLLNGRFLSIRNFLVGTDTVYEKKISLRSTNHVVVFLRGQRRASITLEVGKKSTIQPPEVTFSANPTTIPLGESSTLTWTTANADTVSIDQGIEDVALSGSHVVSPIESTTYTITAMGPGGTAAASAQVTVVTPPKDIDYGLDGDEQQGGGGLVGMKIRILNGNNVLHQPDIQFPSPNHLGLPFAAYYNSQSTSLGSLGYGWTHTYEASLDPAFTMAGREFLKIVDDTGRAVYFGEETGGLYKGIFKERTSVKAEVAGYVWYRLDGSRYGFSDAGKLIWIEDAIRNRLKLAYDAQDRLEKVSDTASGRVLTFHYNADGLVEHISSPLTDAVPDGIWVTYEYDTNQNLTMVTYADGSGFTYSYADPNDIHNLTEKRDKEDHLLGTWSYDERDRCTDNFCVQGKGVSITYVSETQIEVTDAYRTPRTHTMGEVDGRKRVIQMQGPACAPYSESNVIRWAYDDSMNLREVETATGTISQYQDYDERGNPQTVKLAVGTPQERLITYTYHPDMNVPLSRAETSVLGSGNKVTIWDYDDDYDTTPNESPTRLLSRIVEQGFTQDSSETSVPFEYMTTFSYNSKGQVLTIDGPLPGSDDTTSFTYDDVTGGLLSITQPLIGSTNFSDYDAVGRVSRVTDVNGEAKGFTYDAKGRITAIINKADGSSTSIIYNAAGQPDTVTDEDAVTRSFDYDSNGRLSRVTDIEGNYVAYAYDSQGNRIEMTKHDPYDNRTYLKRWSYEHPDIPGKLWKEINGDDAFTEYGYDRGGKIAWVKDPNGNITSYEYDPLNRLVRVTQLGNVITAYAYDSHGNLTAVTDASGNLTSYQYDDLGRLVSTTSPDTGTATYVYDEAGNATAKTDAKGIAAQYTYDLLNRLTGIHFPDATQDISYFYDGDTYGNGRRTGMTDPSGNTTFSYDARGRLTGKTSAILGHSYSISTTFSPGNRVITVTYPTGRTLDYTRDSMGRMKGLSTTYETGTVTLVSNMTYNPFGGPKGLSTGSGGEVNNQSGECDCIKIANPGEQMERIYTYDNNRNLIDIQGTNTSWYNQSFTYDTLNRLTSAEGRYGAINYTYDDVGNRLIRTVNGETANYNYIGGTNRLDQITGANPISFTYDANGNTSAIGTNTLFYNQNNRLIRVEENSLVLGEYTYNGLGQRVIKEVGGGVTTVFHYDLNGKLIAEGLADGTITAEYLYMGKIRIAKVDVSTGNIYYYLNDRIGTPQLMTDDTGTIVWEASYKPFGRASINPKSTVVNNIRFPGQYYDGETGLHYNYFRYYDPRMGRYVRPDPIGLVGGISLYPYVLSNPINITDREGLIAPAVVAPAIIVCLPLLMGAAYYATLPPSQQKFIADKIEQLWDSLWGEPDGNVCEMRDEAPRWDPGPLWDAPGMPGWSPPPNDPNDPDFMKEPKDYEKWSK